MEDKLFNQMVSGGAFESYKKNHRFIVESLSLLSLVVPFLLALTYLFSGETTYIRVFQTLGIVIITYALVVFLVSKLFNSKYCAGKEKWKLLFLKEKKQELEQCILNLDNCLKEYVAKNAEQAKMYKESINKINNYLNNSKN